METPVYSISLDQLLRLARLLSPGEQLMLHTGASPDATEGAVAHQGDNEAADCRGRGQTEPEPEPYRGYAEDQKWARHPDDPLFFVLYGRGGLLGDRLGHICLGGQR